MLLGVLVAACSGPDPGADDVDDGGGNAGSGFGGSGATSGGSGVGGTAGASTGGSPTGGVAGTTGGAGTFGGGSGGAFGGASGTSGASGAGFGGALGGSSGSAGAGAGSGGAGQGGVAGSFGGIGGAGSSGMAGKGGAGGAPGGSGGKGGSGGSAGKGGSGGSAGKGGSGGSAGKGGSGGACQVPTAPSNFQQTIDLTWQEMTGGFAGRTGARPASGSVLNFRNTILDQISVAGGSLNFCVRWESTATVSASMRDSIATALSRGVNEWFSKLVGHNCWPHNQIPVRVVGWATRDRNLLQWSETTPTVYVNDIRENAPQCAEACGRFFHQQAGYTYPQCSGGVANHYDMSLWLTDGFSGGAGGDWGQRVATDYFTQNVNAEHLHIWLHEFGHGFGFPDYYNWDVWAPGVASPNSVMVAGRASLVTDWDTWMLRHTYNQLKSRL